MSTQQLDNYKMEIDWNEDFIEFLVRKHIEEHFPNYGIEYVEISGNINAVLKTK